MFFIRFFLGVFLISLASGQSEIGLNLDRIRLIHRNISIIPDLEIPIVKHCNVQDNSEKLIVKEFLIDGERSGFEKVWIPFILISVLCSVSYAKMTCTPFARKFNALPGNVILPIVGSFYILFVHKEKVSEALSKYFKIHGRTFRLWMLLQPIVLVAEADSAQAVLGSRDHVQKPKLFKNFKWIMGNGLVTSDAALWKNDRKLMEPSFKYQRFDGFLASFNKHSRILVQLLEQRFKAKCEPQNIHYMLCLCGLDFIIESTLGTDNSFQSDTDNIIVKNVAVVLESFRTRLFRPWMKLPFIWRISGWHNTETECSSSITNYLTPFLESRRQLKASTDGVEGGTKPFIDVLINAGKTYKDIIAHATTVFGAGFDTTASGINYTLFLLALNPQYQSKVHEELDVIFGSDINRDVTFNDLADMKYLEMCIKEAMRIFPPAPFVGRTPQSDIKLANGMVIPKGCDVVVCIYDLHRDQRVFPDPEKFDPERFLPEACKNRSNYAYMPFSAGPRNCIGQKYGMMEMKTELAIILRKFHVTTISTRENLRVLYGMVLEPAGCGIKLMFTNRNGEF